MKNSALLTLLFICLGGNHCIAQNKILQKLIKQIDNHNEISYRQVSKQKTPFNKEVSIIRTQSFLVKASANTPELSITKDTRGYKTIFNGVSTTVLDIKSKTYTVQNSSANELEDSPYKWSNFIKEKLISSPSKIKLMKDTIVERQYCYHFKFLLLDSADARNIYDLYFNKSTGFPVYTRQFLQGKMNKGNLVSNEITTIITENYYSGYKTDTHNTSLILGFKIPVGYNAEKKLFALSVGTKGPDWTLHDANGNTVSSKKLRGSLVLIDFSFNACAACILSIPALKKLHSEHSELKIITINTSDTKKAVKWFAQKNGIQYPILLNGTTTGKRYGVSVYPTFFMLDKKGKILAVHEGFSDEVEKSIIAQIQKGR